MHYQTAIDTWPSASREASERVMARYGPPDEACTTRLIWHNNGPWERTEVYREPVHHDWPGPHHDLVLNAVAYRVPAIACADLARFHGSIIVDGTRGEMAARCASEEENILALNLAHQVIQGDRGVEEARAAYASAWARLARGDDEPLAQRLLFDKRIGSVQKPAHAVTVA